MILSDEVVSGSRSRSLSLERETQPSVTATIEIFLPLPVCPAYDYPTLSASLMCSRPRLQKYDVLALKPSNHVRIASLDPTYWERTVTVGSAGKAFSCTGWRIGWLIGPSDLIRSCLAASTRVTFSTNSPLQEAAAEGLEKAGEKRFFENQREWYEKLKDTLLKQLDKLGLP